MLHNLQHHQVKLAFCLRKFRIITRCPLLYGFHNMYPAGLFLTLHCDYMWTICFITTNSIKDMQSITFCIEKSYSGIMPACDMHQNTEIRYLYARLVMLFGQHKCLFCSFCFTFRLFLNCHNCYSWVQQLIEDRSIDKKKMVTINLFLLRISPPSSHSIVVFFFPVGLLLLSMLISK